MRAVAAALALVVAAGGAAATSEGGALDLATAPAAKAAGKPASDWSRYVDDLAVAIRYCVIDAGVQVSEVSIAWPMNHGLAGVRLVDVGGARYDCIAEIASGRIDRVDPVPGRDRLPHEGEPTFWPAREAWPSLACGRAETVRLPGGALFGWLHYTDGCP